MEDLLSGPLKPNSVRTIHSSPALPASAHSQNNSHISLSSINANRSREKSTSAQGASSSGVGSLCLGVKAFFALPSRHSVLHDVVRGKGIHQRCVHNVGSFNLGKDGGETDDDEARQKEQQEQAAGLSPVSQIVGRFQELKQMFSSAEGVYGPSAYFGLTEYIDIMKGKHDRVLLVSEHYRCNLAKEIQNYKRNSLRFSEEVLQQWAFTLLRALATLHRMGIVHRNLCPENVLLDGDRQCKLSDYGTYYITEGGKHACFSIGSPAYLAPEVVAGGPCASVSAQSDTWSVGMILLELVTMSPPLQGTARESGNVSGAGAAQRRGYSVKSVEGEGEGSAQGGTSGDPSLVLLELASMCGHNLEFSMNTQESEAVSGSIQPPPIAFYMQDGQTSQLAQLVRRHESRYMLHKQAMEEDFIYSLQELLCVTHDTSFFLTTLSLSSLYC